MIQKKVCISFVVEKKHREYKFTRAEQSTFTKVNVTRQIKKGTHLILLLFTRISYPSDKYLVCIKFVFVT